MRIFVIALIQLCSVQFMIAQHALFLPFNSSKSDVKEFINSRDYMHEVYYSENTITVKLAGDNEVIYHFEYDLLSSVVMRKYYDRRGEGKSAVKGAVEYLGISADIFMPALESEEGKSNYYGIVGDKILELFVERNGKHTYMQLTANNRHLLQQADSQ